MLPMSADHFEACIMGGWFCQNNSVWAVRLKADFLSQVMPSVTGAPFPARCPHFSKVRTPPPPPHTNERSQVPMFKGWTLQRAGTEGRHTKGGRAKGGCSKGGRGNSGHAKGDTLIHQGWRHQKWSVRPCVRPWYIRPWVHVRPHSALGHPTLMCPAVVQPPLP